jgi:hypothetical protein
MRNYELDERATTDKGLSFQLKSGYEWWFSKKWAAGIGLSYCTSFISTNTTDSGIEKTYTNNIGMLISLTFN